MTVEKLELIHPGEILAEEFLQPLGVSINKLARDIDVPVSRVSDIVSGKRGITADTAMRLAEAFGTQPEFWLNLQSDYDLRKVKRTTWAQTQPRIRSYTNAA